MESIFNMHLSPEHMSDHHNITIGSHQHIISTRRVPYFAILMYSQITVSFVLDILYRVSHKIVKIHLYQYKAMISIVD